MFGGRRHSPVTDVLLAIPRALFAPTAAADLIQVSALLLVLCRVHCPRVVVPRCVPCLQTNVCVLLCALSPPLALLLLVFRRECLPGLCS
jgi:hypothetical protein